MNTLRTAFCALALLLLLTPTISFAAGGSGKHGSIEMLLWPAINFTLYVTIMFFLLRKIIASGWRSRAERIAQEATKGERELTAAQTLVAAARERMTKLPAERAELIKILQAEAEAEARKLASDAAQKSADIERHAAARIAAEQIATAQRTRNRIAMRVLDEAERALRSGVAPEIDKRLRSETARSLQAVKHA